MPLLASSLWPRTNKLRGPRFTTNTQDDNEWATTTDQSGLSSATAGRIPKDAEKSLTARWSGILPIHWLPHVILGPVQKRSKIRHCLWHWQQETRLNKDPSTTWATTLSTMADRPPRRLVMTTTTTETETQVFTSQQRTVMVQEFQQLMASLPLGQRVPFLRMFIHMLRTALENQDKIEYHIYYGHPQ